MKHEKITITPEIDKAFKRELDKRSERIKLDPHHGYSWSETISYLEEKVGRKIEIWHTSRDPETINERLENLE